MKELIKQINNDYVLEDHFPIFTCDLSLGEPLAPKRGNLVNVIVGMGRSGKTFRLFQEIEKLVSRGG